MTNTEVKRPSVVVLGGGYGGLNAAKALDDVADVTLVDPSGAFHHNVASWRALVDPAWIDRIFMPLDRLLHNGHYVRDRAVAVDGRKVTLESGAALEPDYLVLATGSHYPFPAKTGASDHQGGKDRLQAAHDALSGADRALIVGAGPSGLELAGEIKAFYPAKEVTVVDVNADILSGPFQQELREELKRQLDKMGVRLVLGSPLTALPAVDPATPGAVSVATESGETIEADIWFRAFGVRPATDYLRGDLAEARDERGYLVVDDQLRVKGGDGVYALGDIATADRDTAGAASRQGALVAANIKAAITGDGEVQAYDPGPAMIVVPLGPEGGATQLPTGVGGPEEAAAIKGGSMLVEMYSVHFDAPTR
ncbi:NAD(P)/FAD-dependent oxidoreductase [Asanoa iriomotensis]|uniref:NADH dehydrogenase n=1 Tax=Asanoa iriomotensis TaxID=234613 RepID=A0ABQ4C0Q7_9ACTN|nr:FAD-dependent oxidoreductase [Asanoa iriomotensis]GIF56358.1 NADH dehydrogenase [Asanoa iriomotensis]